MLFLTKWFQMFIESKRLLELVFTLFLNFTLLIKKLDKRLCLNVKVEKFGVNVDFNALNKSGRKSVKPQ